MSSTFELPTELHAAIASLIKQQGLLAAVAQVRQQTGASLAAALGAVRSVALAAGLLAGPSQPTELSVEILAVGPFRPALVPLLEYSSDRYAGTREGVTVLTTLVDIYRDSAMVHALAACFGMDPWDFNAHELDAAKVDLDALRQLFPDPEEDVAGRVTALQAAGFRFYFNGPQTAEYF